jgi:outer membrane protein assembly factor BamB
MRLFQTSITLSIVLLLVAATRGDDWPQWMGPTRNDLWAETGILEKFPVAGPSIRWRVKIHGGYSGPAVSNGKVFLMDYQTDGDTTGDPGKRDQLTGVERIACFDTKNGKPIWEYKYEQPYNISYPVGPRATPLVDGQLVYSLGAEGKLLCLKVADGSIVWQKDFNKDYGAKTPYWGFSNHPLIDGPRLFCVVGGEGSTVVAFDKATGKELWKSLNAREQGYSPPTLIQIDARKELVVWDAESLNSLDPTSGKLNWSVPLAASFGMSIMAPRQSGSLLYAAGIVGKGVLLQLGKDKPAAEIVYEVNPTKAISPVNSTPIIDGDHMYGVDRDGQLRGVVLRTGERLWETFAATTGGRRENSGTAFLIKNGNRYFLFSEKGDLIIAKLTPEGYNEISRAHILEPTSKAFGRSVVWSHPAFAEKCMFARNDKELVCVELAE